MRKQKNQHLNDKNETENQTFWKTVNQNFSEKRSNPNQITLLENESVITNYKDNGKTMNIFFINITKKLNLKPHKDSSLTDIN